MSIYKYTFQLCIEFSFANTLFISEYNIQLSLLYLFMNTLFNYEYAIQSLIEYSIYECTIKLCIEEHLGTLYSMKDTVFKFVNTLFNYG